MSMRPLLGPLGHSGPLVDAFWAYSQCLHGCYITYMTGFAKTVLMGRTTEIQFSYSLTLKLHFSTVQAHQAYGYR